MAKLLPIDGPGHMREKEIFEELGSNSLAGLIGALPCVVYEADENLRVTLISPNVEELLIFNLRACLVPTGCAMIG